MAKLFSVIQTVGIVVILAGLCADLSFCESQEHGPRPLAKALFASPLSVADVASIAAADARARAARAGSNLHRMPTGH